MALNVLTHLPKHLKSITLTFDNCYLFYVRKNVQRHPLRSLESPSAFSSQSQRARSAACARPRSSRDPRHQDRKYRDGCDVVWPRTSIVYMRNDTDSECQSLNRGNILREGESAFKRGHMIVSRWRGASRSSIRSFIRLYRARGKL